MTSNIQLQPSYLGFKSGISTDTIDAIRQNGYTNEKITDHFFDKIKDLFFGTDTVKAKMLLATLVDESRSPQISEAKRLETFMALRALSLPQYQNQFSLTITEHDNNTWEYSLNISGTKIYECKDMDNINDISNLPKFKSLQLTMKIEDAFTQKNSGDLLLCLQEIAHTIDHEWHNKAIKFDMDAKNAFSREKIREIISPCQVNKMSEMYDQLMGEFGSKVRSLLNFATDTISEAGQQGIELEAQLISKPTKLERKLENITDILKSNLQKEGLLPSEKAVSASGLSDKELKSQMASRNLMPKPPLITSHTELAENEYNALLDIGLPEKVIKTPVPASLFPT